MSALAPVGAPLTRPARRPMTGDALVDVRRQLARSPASDELLVLLQEAGYGNEFGEPPNALFAMQLAGYLIMYGGRQP